jgi:hypothetical protein
MVTAASRRSTDEEKCQARAVPTSDLCQYPSSTVNGSVVVDVIIPQGRRFQNSSSVFVVSSQKQQAI